MSGFLYGCEEKHRTQEQGRKERKNRALLKSAPPISKMVRGHDDRKTEKQKQKTESKADLLLQSLGFLGRKGNNKLKSHLLNEQRNRHSGHIRKGT